MNPETRIVRRITSWLKTVPECFFLKFHGSVFGRVGVPDLLVVYRGRAIWFEVKTESGQCTPIQLHTHVLLAKAGAVVSVVRSLEQTQEVLNDVQ